VGAGWPNVMRGAADHMYIGNLADLPNRGAGLAPGGEIAFRAGGPAMEKQRPGKPVTAGQYWTRVAQTSQAPEGLRHPAPQPSRK
jgi:hypothetical protein